MAMEQIKSFQNSYVKKIRSLKYKKYRQREKLFWAEGIRPAPDENFRQRPEDSRPPLEVD